MYNTSLGVIFGVKKYAERLLEVVKKKGIELNYKHKLVEVNVPSKEAVFEVLEEDRTVTFKVSQITPTSSHWIRYIRGPTHFYDSYLHVCLGSFAITTTVP